MEYFIKEQIDALSENVQISYMEEIDETHTMMRICTGWSTTEEDVEKAITEQAEQMGQDPETFRKNLTEEQKGYLKDNAAIRLVLDLLRKDAKIVEKKAEEPEEKKPAKKPAAKKTAAKKAETEEAADEKPARKPAAKKTTKKTDAE